VIIFFNLIVFSGVLHGFMAGCATDR